MNRKKEHSCACPSALQWLYHLSTALLLLFCALFSFTFLTRLLLSTFALISTLCSKSCPHLRIKPEIFCQFEDSSLKMRPNLSQFLPPHLSRHMTMTDDDNLIRMIKAEDISCTLMVLVSDHFLRPLLIFLDPLPHPISILCLSVCEGRSFPPKCRFARNLVTFMAITRLSPVVSNFPLHLRPLTIYLKPDTYLHIFWPSVHFHLHDIITTLFVYERLVHVSLSGYCCCSFPLWIHKHEK